MARSLGMLLLSAVLSTFSATWAPASSVAFAAELDKKGKSDAKEAMRFYKEGNYEDAAKLFLRLSLAYPDMLVFVRNLGACYYYMRRYEPALSNLRDYLHRKTDIAPDDRAEVAGWVGEMERIRDQTTAVTPPATAPPPAAAVAPVPVPPVPVPTPGTPAAGVPAAPGAPPTSTESPGVAGAAPVPVPGVPTPPVAAPGAPAAAPAPPATPPPAPGPEPAFPPQYPQPSFPAQGAYPPPPTYPQPGPYPAQPEYPAPGAYPPAPQPYPPMTSSPGYAPQPGYAPAAGPPLGVATQAPPPPPPPQGSSTGRKVAAWMLAIAGLGTAGAGGYFTYRAHSKAKDLEKKYSPSVEDERKKAVIYSGVCYGVGGALVLTGIIVGATGGSSGGVALAPTVGPGTAGATLSGSF